MINALTVTPYIFIVYSKITQKVNTYKCDISRQNQFEGQTLTVTDASLMSTKIFQEKAFTRHTKARCIYFLLKLCSVSDMNQPYILHSFETYTCFYNAPSIEMLHYKMFSINKYRFSYRHSTTHNITFLHVA
jgi:hypothetical protein